MAKATSTRTVTKSARNDAINKTGSRNKTTAEKTKREPSAYQTFCKENMKKWNEQNPGRAKEAMTQIALLWKDAPENPNRGQEAKSRKPKVPKQPKEDKAKKPRAKKPKKVDVEDEDRADNSDPVDADDDDE